MLLLVPLLTPAFGQDAVTLEYVKKGQVATSLPSFTVIANSDASSLSVSGACGGVSFKRSGTAQSGEKWHFPLDLPVGNYSCRGALSVELDNGETGEMPLSFTVQQLPRLQMRVSPGTLDVAGRKVGIILDRTAGRVEITVLGPKGVELGGSMTHSISAAGQVIECAWTQRPDDAMKLKIRAFDENGFYSDLELSPWRYSVPHEDVIFATNAAVIDGAEEPKLITAMEEVRGVLDKYGTDVVIKLYVAGHTDTVGSPDKNQTLSMDRAKSISAWFKKAGFPGDIYYQGMGERDLGVPTADEIDEPRNRRVAYTLAAQSPDMPSDVSGLTWVPLH